MRSIEEIEKIIRASSKKKLNMPKCHNMATIYGLLIVSGIEVRPHKVFLALDYLFTNNVSDEETIKKVILKMMNGENSKSLTVKMGYRILEIFDIRP